MKKPRRRGVTGAEVAAIAAKVERMTAAEFEEWALHGSGYDDCKKMAGSCLSQSRRKSAAGRTKRNAEDHRSAGRSATAQSARKPVKSPRRAA